MLSGMQRSEFQKLFEEKPGANKKSHEINHQLLRCPWVTKIRIQIKIHQGVLCSNNEFNQQNLGKLTKEHADCWTKSINPFDQRYMQDDKRIYQGQ